MNTSSRSIKLQYFNLIHSSIVLTETPAVETSELREKEGPSTLDESYPSRLNFFLFLSFCHLLIVVQLGVIIAGPLFSLHPMTTSRTSYLI